VSAGREALSSDPDSPQPAVTRAIMAMPRRVLLADVLRLDRCAGASARRLLRRVWLIRET
jgi:hypothetical protein